MITIENYKQYCDKYFLRSRIILEKENLNPIVRAQVFLRKPGYFDFDKTIDFLTEFGKLNKDNAKIWIKEKIKAYESCETVMLIEAPIQNIVELETIYLGDISYHTTQRSCNNSFWSNEAKRKIKDIVVQIRKLIGDERQLIYMGARHWLWRWDDEFSKAAFDGGCDECSTDIGAATVGKEGIGTIPHALENIFAWRYSKNNAVLESTVAFDKHMNKSIPRIALVDYNNAEYTDTIAAYNQLGDKLTGVRIDTSGENLMEIAWIQKNILLNYNGKMNFSCCNADIEINQEQIKYWLGKGVTISGAYNFVHMLEEKGIRNKIKIILSSGFGNPKKVEAFVEAEKQLNTKLFDGLGIGNVFGMEELRIATMDIVGISEDGENWKEISKSGRSYKSNSTLSRVL